MVVSVKQKVGIGITIVGIITLLVITSLFLTQQSAVFFLEPVFSYDFGNSICRGFNSEVDYNPQNFKSGGSIICGENSYVTGSCAYNVLVSGAFSSIFNAKDCDRNTDNCVNINKIGERNQVFNIKSGRRLFLNLNSPNEDSSIIEKSVVYRLESTSGDGFLSLAKDCSVGGVNKKLKDSSITSIFKNERDSLETLRYWDGGLMLKPDEVVNYVANMKEVISANNVRIDEINNGQPVYIPSPGQWCPILKDEEGNNLVNLEECKIDERIECYPADINFCTPDAKQKMQPTIGEDCPLGTTQEFKIVGDEYCRVSCEDGKISTFSECIPRTNCPLDKPFFNTITGTCEKGFTPVPPEPGEVECRAEGGQWVDKESRTCGILCNLWLEQPSVVSESFCDKPSILLYVIIGLVVGGVILLGSNLSRGGRKR